MTSKILLVDSSSNFRLIVKNKFNAYDCDFIEADNGRKGLAFAINKKPDLVILDVNLPLMTGDEMLRNLKSKKEFRNIPVIMITAESEQSKVLEFAKLGLQGYFVKPLRGDELIKKVEDLLDLQPRKSFTPTRNISDTYFTVKGDILFFKIPENVTKRLREDLEDHLHPKIVEVTNTGILKFILDLSKVKLLNIHLIKLTITTINKCRQSNRRFRIVADQNLGNELNQFEEISNISFDHSIEAAMAALGSA